MSTKAGQLHTDSTIAGSLRSYTYNGDGLLRSRSGAGATNFLWDPSSAPSRELKQGSDNIVYGLGPLYVVKTDASTLTFARDGGKSVRAEVNGAGSVTASFRYKAYGQMAQFNGSAVPNYLGYAGQLLDPSGLYYMRARWYDPATGRFVSRDPLDSNPASPETLNPYDYAAANPALRTDPSGLRVAEPYGDLLLNGGGGCASGTPGGACGGGGGLGGGKSWNGRFPWSDLTDRVGSSFRSFFGGGQRPPQIKVAIEDLIHVLTGHIPGGSRSAGNSTFEPDTDLFVLLRAAEPVVPNAQSYGPNLQRIVDAGRPIGFDYTVKAVTTVYTVITDINGWLVTMFPGLPTR